MRGSLFGKDSVLGEMLIGILFFGILVQIVGLIFFQEKVFYAIGLWIGVVVAMATAIHMAYTMDKVVDAGEGKASAKLRMYAMLRYLVIVLAVMAVYYFKIGNPLTCFAGIMGLKIGAYLQPLTHKILRR
ncbi:MAG: hypothetical protein Q4G60_04940 [bacterium]|nr:hypothetical protein [bacterium]